MHAASGVRHRSTLARLAIRCLAPSGSYPSNRAYRDLARAGFRRAPIEKHTANILQDPVGSGFRTRRSYNMRLLTVMVLTLLAGSSHAQSAESTQSRCETVDRSTCRPRQRFSKKARRRQFRAKPQARRREACAHRSSMEEVAGKHLYGMPPAALKASAGL